MMLSRTRPPGRSPSRTRRFGRLVVVAAISCCVIAVPAVAAAGAAAAAASDMTLSKPVAVKAAGLSLRYPAAWTIVASGSRKEALARRKAFVKANPKLAKVYDEQAASSSEANIKFRAPATWRHKPRTFPLPT